MSELFQNSVLPLAMTIPFVAALLIALAPRKWTETLSVLASLATVVCVAPVLTAVLSGEAPSWAWMNLAPGAALAFRVDSLGATFGGLASGLWVITTIYSIGYSRADKMESRRRYFASFAAAIGTTLGVAFSANLLTFLLFYELLTLSTWPLVAHNETPEAIAGGRKYLVYTLLGGLSLTVAVAWVWLLVGDLDFRAGGFLGDQSPAVLAVLFALFMFGCGVKAAIMPAHAWLPAAMVAPTPVSALLHAVAVVKAGVFGCLRVLGFVFGPEYLSNSAASTIVLILCATTIVAGSLVALRQDHLKMRLAYSTIVHLSYIVLGAALVSPLGMTGATLHMVNHGLAKITLFFCAGAIYETTHLERISQFRGLGRRMPWTFGLFAAASLSMIGVPGFCGFVSKLYLARGAIQAGEMLCLAIMVGASLLTASYLLPIVWTAFFETAPAAEEGHDAPSAKCETSPAMLLPLAVTAALTVIFGLLPWMIGPQLALARDVAARVFGGMP